MDKKLSVRQRLLIGSIITPIGLHLKYPWNLFVVAFGILALVISVIKDKEKYNKFNFVGMLSAIIGSIVVFLMIMGKLNDYSLSVLIVASLGMIFLGVVLIGVGNHIKDPEKVSKKSLIFFSGFFAFMLLYFLILANLKKWI